MAQSSIEKNTLLVKSMARELGFDHCGISTARFLEEDAKRLDQWLTQGMQGRMLYMEKHLDKRLDPRKLVPGAKTVVSLVYNYYPANKSLTNSKFKVAKYAYGKDYHLVIRGKLKQFIGLIRQQIGDVEGRAFVDSAPVMERQWAQQSGIGWLGKNSLLINKRQGSFFFLAEMILDLELSPDAPHADHCGTCSRCIDACPTEAIPEEGVVDASRCISYFTIELKEAIPDGFKGSYSDWIFGCDICQDVCPWNRFSMIHREPEFLPDNEVVNMEDDDWIELTEEVFNKRFGKSALKRSGFEGIKRNIRFVRDKSK